jgi:hypothetical protein
MRLTRHFLILFARNKFANWSARLFVNHMAKSTRRSAGGRALSNWFVRLLDENNNWFRIFAAVIAKFRPIFNASHDPLPRTVNLVRKICSI